MQFPIINISEASFQRGNQFDVIYSERLNITPKKFKVEYKNEEVIDANGDYYLIWGANDAPQDLGNIARGIQLMPFFAKNSTKVTMQGKSGIILLFKKMDKTISLEELRSILIAKIPDFHFSQEKQEQEALLGELNKCDSFAELMNMVYEE